MMYYYKWYSFSKLRDFSKYSWKIAKDVSEQYGGTRLGVWLHMMWCCFRYGATHTLDYTLFEFYKKRGREINRFLTYRRFWKLVKQFDKETFYHTIDKANCYKTYSQFIKRDWLLTNDTTNDDEIRNFIGKHHKILVKPISMDSGKGIFTVSETDTDAINEFLQERKNTTYLLEEICENCEELKAINPSSLNTLRIDTMVNADGEIEIFSVHLRCGCGGSIVDNWGAGGVAYPIDVKTGIINAPGLDLQGHRFIYHPGTEKVMIGYKAPRYEEACQFAKDIIRTNKKVVFAGLDLAILEDRIELIEVNFPPAHFFLQAVDQVGRYQYTKRMKRF
jgi:hypothetical protein